MEQHPIPRQITSFEFKLIGFMTLHQFIYLLVFVPTGVVVYKTIPIPFLNILVGLAISSIGVLLAFLPVNDRPLDVFIKNLYKRLTSPTQYLYKKNNPPPSFLVGAQSQTNTQTVADHVDSQDKLSKYIQSTTETSSTTQNNVQMAVGVQAAFKEPLPKDPATKLPEKVVATVTQPTANISKEATTSNKQQPFFIGVVKNNKDKPLPEILVYVKDESNNPVRLLKTNPHGVFATYSSLPKGEYMVEAKDPRGSYLFDTMKIRLSDANPAPFTMLSKGLL